MSDLDARLLEVCAARALARGEEDAGADGLAEVCALLAKEGPPPGRELLVRNLLFDAMPWIEEHLPPELAAALLAQLEGLSVKARVSRSHPPVFTEAFRERYELVGPLGEGGMGIVYRAVQRSLARPVAIKLLAPQMATEENQRRFREEALLAARIFHPNLVAVIETGDTGGCPYIAFEFIEGPSLRAHLDRNPGGLPVGQAVEFARQAAEGVACAHGHGIIHRDLKPDNLLIAQGNVIKVADFGIAKSAQAPAADAKSRTQAGQILGTPLYMAPEQAQERPLTPVCDVYSLGVVLYEMLAGRVPFDGSYTLEILDKHVKAPPPPLPHGIPEAVCAVVERALAKEPEARYGSMRELADALRDLGPALARTTGDQRMMKPIVAEPRAGVSGAVTVMTTGRTVPSRGTLPSAILAPPRTPPRPVVVAALAAVACAVVGLGVMASRPTVAPPPPSARSSPEHVDFDPTYVEHGPRGRKQIALTFDDGPTGGGKDTGTGAILDVLRATGAHASFFVVGGDAVDHPDLVKRIRREGHTLGSLGSRACHLEQLTPAGQRTIVHHGLEQIRTALGDPHAAIRFFRLMHGDHGESRNPATLRIIHDDHPVIALWSLDTEDYRNFDHQDLAATVHTILDEGRGLDGGIVLMREGSPGAAVITRQVIEALRPQGYTFVSLDEMLGR